MTCVGNDAHHVAVKTSPHVGKSEDLKCDNLGENPEEYERKLEELEKKLKEAEESRKKELSEPPKPLTGKTGSWPPKTLNEIMKVEMVQDKSAEEVEEIWKQHHLHKDGVFSVIKKSDFDAMMSNAGEFPTFIYALPRADGYEFILSQFSENNVYFTSLQMFQMLKENAQASLTIAHFTDFKDTKGIVLMAGKFDEKFLNQMEAVNLVKQMALFYGTDSGERRHLLAAFNNSPTSFNHMDVIEEYKKIRQKVELFA
ncbi:ATP synthase mitochondrial F1 complex assembly factor 1-like isoform X2 [Liolophura sinensis]|uniref:ATP synthase mitochondrial F1 complex assembly factor 1-like isoform X2 n=1 Tax=Liolophura sinensis TaxID=3198878 RepID=UPI003158B438